jgi:hypothetical protein
LERLLYPRAVAGGAAIPDQASLTDLDLEYFVSRLGRSGGLRLCIYQLYLCKASCPNQISAGGGEVDHKIPASAANLFRACQGPDSDHLSLSRVFISITPASKVHDIEVEQAQR